MLLLRHLLSILVLPFAVVVIVPALIQSGSAPGAPSPVRLVAGVVVLGFGLWLVGSTIWQFATRGGGTLAPWDPPVRLVVAGVYRYVRNPMISGVFLLVMGESVLFRSPQIALWAAIFFALNATYIPLVEERSLMRRFGADYGAYRHHVPRWIPRLKPWRCSD